MSVLLEPKVIQYTSAINLEISLHSCDASFQRELRHIFQNVDLNNVLILPTIQRSHYDLVTFGEEVDDHKDFLLENVYLLITYDKT